MSGRTPEKTNSNNLLKTVSCHLPAGGTREQYWSLIEPCTCHCEPVHVVEQVDVAEDEDGQQGSDFGHAAGLLLLRPLRHRAAATVLLRLRLAIIGKERHRV